MEDIGADGNKRTRSANNPCWDPSDTMESFIKHQMMVILQPLVDRLQSLDDAVLKLGDRTSQAESSGNADRAVAERFKADLVDVRTELKKVNARLTSSHERIDACMRRDEELLLGMENSNGHVQQVHDHGQETARMVLQLQHELGELSCESQALRAQLQRTSDGVANDVTRTLDLLGSSLKDVKTYQTKAANDIVQLKQDVHRQDELIQDARKSLDKSACGAVEVRKLLEELGSKEAQLSSKLEGWKSQWSKLHPAVDALRKDALFLKQGYEHHDQMIISLQQGYSTTFSGLEDARKSQERAQAEIKSIQGELYVMKRDHGETADSLEKNASFANSINSAQKRMTEELRSAVMKLDGLESKHYGLFEGVEKTNNNVSELLRGQQTSTTNLQVLQHEVEKAFENLENTKGQLDSTNLDLTGLKDELGRTSAAVQKLDQGVESCRASFSGMARGFMETGRASFSEMRTPNLPKIPPSSSTPSPKVVAAFGDMFANGRDKGAVGDCESRASSDIPDNSSTTVEEDSVFSSRRSTLCMDLLDRSVEAGRRSSSKSRQSAVWESS
jgi:predicted  nucleic acid-binding Zn-ribbon protein